MTEKETAPYFDGGPAFTLNDVCLRRASVVEVNAIEVALNDAYHAAHEDFPAEAWAEKSAVLAEEVLRLRYTIEQERKVAGKAMQIRRDCEAGPNVHVIEALVQAERAQAHGVGPTAGEALAQVIKHMRIALGLTHRA